jgi:hypothetical protein
MLETSPEIDLLVEALHGFQGEVVTVGRNVVNPFFRRKYADLCAIMVETQPILNEYGLVISQFPDNVEGQPALTTMLAHCSGQFIKATIPLPVSKVTVETLKETKTTTSDGFDPQEFGRAVTYMRRYGYAAVLQIVIDEDDDGNTSNRRYEQPSPPPPSNPQIIEKIQKIWTEGGGTIETLDSWVKKNNNNLSLDKLSGERQASLLQVLEAKKAAKAAETKPSTEKPATE